MKDQIQIQNLQTIIFTLKAYEMFHIHGNEFCIVMPQYKLDTEYSRLSIISVLKWDANKSRERNASNGVVFVIKPVNQQYIL